MIKIDDFKILTENGEEEWDVFAMLRFDRGVLKWSRLGLKDRLKHCLHPQLAQHYQIFPYNYIRYALRTQGKSAPSTAWQTVRIREFLEELKTKGIIWQLPTGNVTLAINGKPHSFNSIKGVHYVHESDDVQIIQGLSHENKGS